MGTYTWTGWHCFDFVALTVYDGHLTFVTPNGDEVYLLYEAVLTGPNTWLEEDTIVGGTGRFENATGWSITYGESSETPEGTVWNLMYDGMMSSLGSSK